MNNFLKLNKKKNIESCKLNLENELSDTISRVIGEINKSVRVEGLYRKSGNKDNLIKTLNIIHKKPNEKITFEGDDIHDLTSLLKTIILQLDPPLIPKKIIENFIDEYDETDAAVKQQRVEQDVKGLSTIQQTTLRYLMLHFIKIIDNAEFNRMTKDNMCIIWAPALYCPLVDMSIIPKCINFVSILIDLYEMEEENAGNRKETPTWKNASENIDESSGDERLTETRQLEYQNESNKSSYENVEKATQGTRVEEGSGSVCTETEGKLKAIASPERRNEVNERSLDSHDENQPNRKETSNKECFSGDARETSKLDSTVNETPSDRVSSSAKFIAFILNRRK